MDNGDDLGAPGRDKGPCRFTVRKVALSGQGTCHTGGQALLPCQFCRGASPMGRPTISMLSPTVTSRSDNDGKARFCLTGARQYVL